MTLKSSSSCTLDHAPVVEAHLGLEDGSVVADLAVDDGTFTGVREGRRRGALEIAAFERLVVAAGAR